jgi:hypothetical protein
MEIIMVTIEIIIYDYTFITNQYSTDPPDESPHALKGLLGTNGSLDRADEGPGLCRQQMALRNVEEVI